MVILPQQIVSLAMTIFFEGTVVEGNKLGRSLGYPTANLSIEDEEKLIPGNGVYVVEAQIRNQADRGRIQGMMNIGIRPTLTDGKFMIEINFFDFDQDIYGKVIRVYVKQFLRPEMKFQDLEELKEQLRKDKEKSLDYFAGR